jgi:hypothetical protein
MKKLQTCSYTLRRSVMTVDVDSWKSDEELLTGLSNPSSLTSKKFRAGALSGWKKGHLYKGCYRTIPTARAK